ncbi:MAG: dockerin type I repeat-containing protein [Ruminococcus flavefaciens]|nr:dockerin type I repeat-containing protein [Ruminococcus flavefaciens]
MKKFLSALMSMTVALCAVPVVSVAENGETASKPLPYTISGDTLTFEGDKNYDYIISTHSDFKTERTDDTYSFTLEENGKYMISRVWLEENIIDYHIDVDTLYNLIPDTDTEIHPVINEGIDCHCHYFYPHIQNFEVIYYTSTGIKEVIFLGEHSFYNKNTVEEIKTKPSLTCYDYTEMETSDILDQSVYYALASSHMLLDDSGAFFMYYDYGWNDEKDRSLFCVDSGHYNQQYPDYIDISGNATITKTLEGASFVDGNLECPTPDMVEYTIIEPFADGFAEVYSFIVSPMSSTILTIENGKFIPQRHSLGCELPEYGDINIDGYINIADAVIFQRYLLGQTNLTQTQYACSDLNYDGTVDIFDMVLLRQQIIEVNNLGVNYSGDECGKNPEIS